MTGILSKDKTKILRSYNVGTDASIGNNYPKNKVFKLKLDWDELYKKSSLSLSPHISYAHEKAQIGTFSEAGGLLPLSFNASTQRTNFISAGLEANRKINQSLGMTGSIDISHTLNKKTSAISGLIASAIPFSQIQTKDGGNTEGYAKIGIHKKIGAGTLSTNINVVAAEHEKPTWWVNSSYGINF